MGSVTKRCRIGDADVIYLSPMSATTTRTLNPLPFQDLEPKRFEDLVRQLAYDFRNWRRLEATGRAGSDDGFDARGLEIVPLDAPVSSDEEVEGEAEIGESAADRLWLIQCKRERRISPKKLEQYLGEIALSPDERLHGIIFAAACDFSKRTHDVFLAWCRANGIAEAILWGKGEIEDMLFQPKNDNLLFAYFGISLSIRRRNQATQIRADIATKRKLKRTVLHSSAEVLVRDPAADKYPYVAEGKRPDNWWVYRPEELTHAGLSLSIAWYYAYIDPETGAWDAADTVNASHSRHRWRIKDEKREELEAKARLAWDLLPEENRGWLKVSGIVPLKDIVAIDEFGDDMFDGVHIYVPFQGDLGPFAGGCWHTLELVRSTRFAPLPTVRPEPDRRIVKFPADTRRPD